MNSRALAAALAALACAACSSAPFAEPLPAGTGGVSVEATVRPKAALQAFAPDLVRGGGGGPAFEKIDYRRFADMAAWLEGDALPASGGPAPAAASLAALEDGFDRLLVLAAPKGATAISLVNRRRAPVTLFAVGPTGDGFDERIEPGATAVVTLAEPGRYEVAAQEDDRLRAEIVVAPTSWAAPARSGDPVAFAPLPPGEYRLTVAAARLPSHEGRVTVRAGERVTVRAALGVDRLPPGRKEE